MTDFNVFHPTAIGAEAQDIIERGQQAIRRLEQERRAAILAALGHPPGRAWLEALLAREYARPSYQPGDDFASTAYRQGRIAVLREIAEQLHAASQPIPTGE